MSAPGAVIYLPVNADGALLYVGDCHAVQGDGELCGVALENPVHHHAPDRPDQGPELSRGRGSRPRHVS